MRGISSPFLGVVSDTHGYYDAALDELFAGAERIIHAGDIGSLHVLTRLRAIAPVTAVLGNVDLPSWGDSLPWETEVTAIGLRVLICHIGKSVMGRHDPVAEGFDVVVSGHSHRAAVEWRGNTLFLNPGAAGEARFGLSRTVARVTVAADGRPAPEIVPLS